MPTNDARGEEDECEKNTNANVSVFCRLCTNEIDDISVRGPWIYFVFFSFEILLILLETLLGHWMLMATRRAQCVNETK